MKMNSSVVRSANHRSLQATARNHATRARARAWFPQADDIVTLWFLRLIPERNDMILSSGRDDDGGRQALQVRSQQ